MRLNRIFHALLLLALGASFLGLGPAAPTQALTQTTNPEVLLARMSPEERVGQLFLVTFRGTDTSPEAPIYDLIANRHVGGVLLWRENDNFLAAPDTVTGAHTLIGDLQTIEWEATTRVTGQAPQYIPLLVGISQEGNGAPYDQILTGLTPLPSAMALGATWDTALVQQVGEVAGSELRALGFNLFLGPSLDVMETPSPEMVSDLGTRVFGGNPFWVGELGRAFVTGLHIGAQNRMLVVAKHFPGRGSSDRVPENEVATVRKPLEQLKQVELLPFFTVTRAGDTAGLVDGLLVSHIRYQGFQGNIRATTRPVSFDASALPAIMALPEFSAWQAGGGLLVSESLGSDAVRAFYSQQGADNFSPRLVAREAFLAGNDLLYLGNITANAETDTYTTTLAILDYFAQEYRNDPVFAQRVDAAVLRILTYKLRLYPTRELASVLTPASSLTTLGTAQQAMFDIARNAVTLVSPDAQELSTVLPQLPLRSDRIVFLTDTVASQQCSACPVQDGLAVDALQKDVVRLFGQSGSAQIQANRLSSYSLTELANLLNGESETEIEADLSRATWVVISLADVGGEQLTTLRRLFAEKPTLTRSKNIILFSFTAPYYLDATDISKFTAYYVLYSKQPAFIDVAARLLFQQVPLEGTSPVSISAMGYDLMVTTSPDPAQVIPVSLDETASARAETGTLTPEPTLPPAYRIGDTIAVRAGPILDRNGHIVPDGTVARFVMSTRDDVNSILKQEEVTTVQGIARATFVIDKPGSVEIRVVSEPALTSVVLQFIASAEGVIVTEVAPTAMPTATELPLTPTPVATPVWFTSEGYPRLNGWFLALLALFGSVGLVFWAVSKLDSIQWAVRWALCMLVGGLLGYNYLALGFPGAADWVAASAGVNGILLLTFIGETCGGVVALLWMRQSTRQSGEQADQ